MNKEELNQEIGKLKASLEMHESQVKDLQQDLQIAEKKLADSNKPQLTTKQLNAIENAIETSVNSYRFDDVSQYDYEMGMEYDNQVYLSHIEFQDHGDLISDIYANVEDLFGIADESDDDQGDRE
tara:strand:+ start:538 stop:912 length:375 start_codon:yes stop_codon:yes gene_type:complete